MRWNDARRLLRLETRFSGPEKARLVADLMSARRAVRNARGDAAAFKTARARVDAAKHALGERGDPWWTDGAPDWNRYLAKNTPYAGWFAGVRGE